MITPHRPGLRKLLHAGIVLGVAGCAAAIATGSAAAAQDCFLIFCPPGQEPWQQQQPQAPSWQGLPGTPEPSREGRRPVADGDFGRMYGDIDGEPFPVVAFRTSDVDPAFLRRTVMYQTDEQPGTIVIDPQRHFLYFVEGEGRAVRYGVGVGRTGFGWSGVATLHNKQEWPDWYPPKEMIQRQPELRRAMSELQSGLGMAGGPRNPLGARAMYLWQGNKDTLFRIHGTVEPWTIGKSVSSGCIRMINQDVIDLYERAPVGAKVVVLSGRESTALR